MRRYVSVLIGLLLPLAAAADIRHYVAPLGDSHWRLGENTRVRCTLEHDIPAYGKAVFSSEAGEKPEFALYPGYVE